MSDPLIKEVDQEFDNGSEEDSEPLLLRPVITSPEQEDETVFVTKEKAFAKYRICIIALAVTCVILIVILVAIALRCNKKHTESKHSTHQAIIAMNFFHLSDTHLDLYYNKTISNVDDEKKEQMCRNIHRTGSTAEIIKSNNIALFARVGCDSSELLLQSAADEMDRINKKSFVPAEFVLLTGDQTAHDYKFFDVNLLNSVLWSIGNSTRIISDTLKIPVFPAIGNNDLVVDYDPPTSNSSFYKMVRNILEQYIFRSPAVIKWNSRDEFETTFDLGGYYKMVTQGGKLVFLILNTNYLSSRAYRINPKVTEIGDKQMHWLDTQLFTAQKNNQSVIIAGHIPPGVSTYKGDKNMWMLNYTDIYINMTTVRYADVITSQLYGHTHSDKIKLQHKSDVFLSKHSKQNSYLLLCPSITPIFRGNPAFRLVEYDVIRNRINDYTQFYLDLTSANAYKKATWQKEYSFIELYNKEITSSDLNSIIDQLLNTTNPTWYHYSTHMNTLYGSVLTTQRFREYCGAKHNDINAYEKCLAHYKNIGV